MFFFKILIFILLPFLLNGQQKINTTGNNSPIEIYAEEGIEWHQKTKKYVANGNTRAIKGDLELTSDVIEAFYEEKNGSESDIKLIKARGNVTIENNETLLTGGQNAVYNLDKDYFLIKGEKLNLKSNGDELKARKKIEYWNKENIAVATGDAIAYQKKKYLLKAEKLVWYLEPDKTDKDYEIIKIMGFEKVIIETENEVAFSDKALYNKKSEICKLFGNVKLKRGENFLTGEYAEMNLKTGVSKLLPFPKGKLFKNEKRVKALIRKNSD